MPSDIKILSDTFAVLTPELELRTAELSPTVYEELDERFSQFKGHVLVSSHSFLSDWPSWEMHPAGDELVMLLAGQCQLTLRQKEEEKTLILEQCGSYVIVPKGTWHTAKIANQATLLFITPGEDTHNSTEPD
jgi:mannose-6-phosphate isomerase-like protein (cupin superfamily)